MIPIGLKISFLEFGIIKIKKEQIRGTNSREIIIAFIVAPSE